MPVLNNGPTPTVEILRTVSSSEAASLHGKKALTPMISGSVCGGIMGILYIIGFTVYFIKRYKRKKLKRAVEAGRKQPKLKAPVKEEPIVIPPDPAVLFGQRQAGEYAFPDKQKNASKDKLPHFHPPSFHHHHSKSKSKPDNTPTPTNESNPSVDHYHTPNDSPVTRPLLPSNIREADEHTQSM